MRRSGASWAAQWLPRSNSLQETMLAWSRWAKRRIGRKSKAKLASQGKHTPFSGYELPGRVRMTLVGGQVAFEQG